MKIRKVFMYCIVIGTIFMSCSQDDHCLIGSGNVNNYELDLSEFNSISLSGPINLRIKQGSEQHINVIAEPEMFRPLEYKVSNGNLKIGYNGNVTCFETDYGVWVEIVVPNLTGVSISGISEVFSIGNLDLQNLKIEVSGKAFFELSGQLEDQIIISSGEIKIKNFNFKSETTSISIDGAGNLEVNCNDELEIDVRGKAVLKYKGHPTIDQRVSGSLELIESN